MWPLAGSTCQNQACQGPQYAMLFGTALVEDLGRRDVQVTQANGRMHSKSSGKH